MIKQRRGRPPKPPDEVRTVRVTVLLTEREHATLLRACGGRGVATMLVRGGLREAGPLTVSASLQCVDCGDIIVPGAMNAEGCELRKGGWVCGTCVDTTRPTVALASALLDGATPERLAWLAGVGEALTVTSGTRVGKSEASRKVVAMAKAAGVPVKVVKR